MRTFRVSLLLLSMSASHPAFAAGKPQVSIAEAVAEAIDNNPGLIAERAGISVAQTAIVTARLRPNPVVSYSADHLDALGTGFNDTNNAGPPELALRIDMPWERGNKRAMRMDAAGYQARIAAQKLADSARRLTLDVTLACIDVLEAKSRLELAKENLTSLEGIVRLNESRVNAGATAPVELTRSRVAMLQFRSSVKTAELLLTTSRLRLQTLLGRASAVDVAGDLKAPLPVAPPDLTRISETAFARRPDLQAILLDQARSQADLRLQVAQGKVDYTVGAEYRRQQGVNGKGNSLGVFFSVPVPVFSRNQGEIARAQAEHEQLRKSELSLRSQISGEVAAAWNEFETARGLVSEIERDLLGPSQEAKTVTAYVYQAGASSLIDVLDAQRAFNETMSAYYSAQADYRRAASRLASAVGEEVIP